LTFPSARTIIVLALGRAIPASNSLKQGGQLPVPCRYLVRSSNFSNEMRVLAVGPKLKGNTNE
jgi:hypothetical protein